MPGALIIDMVDGIEYGEEIGQDYFDGELVPDGINKKKKAKTRHETPKQEKPSLPSLELPLQEHDFTKE